MQFHLRGKSSASSAQSPFSAASLCCSLTALTVASLGFSSAANASDLVPHRAVYELSLIQAERDSGIGYASGLFAFEVTGSACAGWSIASDMALSLEGAAGQPIQTQTSYRAFEDGAGQVFTFQTNTETNNEAPISSAGAAERDPLGTLSIRRFGEDETSTAAVAETLFPNQLTEAVLQAAQNDQHLMFTTVFDGSHETGLAQPVTAIIGDAMEPSVLAPFPMQVDMESENAAEQTLWEDFPAPTAAWPVTLSYFHPDEPDAGPSFTVEYTLDTNGVSNDLILDYGSFTLRGELADFAPFEPAACS